MAYSSIMGADPAPTNPSGRGADLLGPSDNSDSGSDTIGTSEAHEDSDARGHRQCEKYPFDVHCGPFHVYVSSASAERGNRRATHVRERSRSLGGTGGPDRVTELGSGGAAARAEPIAQSPGTRHRSPSPICRA